MKTHFLAGQLPEFARDPLGYLEATARGSDDRVPLDLGYARALLLRHPDDIFEVLVTRAHDFHKAGTTRRLQ